VTRYLSLAEYVWLAEQVTDVESAVLMKASRLDLADSALHAPFAGFEDQDFLSRHRRQGRRPDLPAGLEPPAPDGNKRAAWASLVMFIDLNDGVWDPDPPNVDEAEAAMLAVAAPRSTKPGSPTGYGVGCTSGDGRRAGWEPTRDQLGRRSRSVLSIQ